MHCLSIGLTPTNSKVSMNARVVVYLVVIIEVVFIVVLVLVRRTSRTNLGGVCTGTEKSFAVDAAVHLL